MKKTRLLIVDDQRIFADGLRFAIESRTKDLEVVGIAENGREALSRMKPPVPDIVVMDVRMPVVDGVEATRQIRERFPEVKILILTTFDDDEYVRQSLQYGANGYLLKTRSADELIASIHALARGILQIDPAVSGKAFYPPQRTPGSEETMARLHSLTDRERQVLRLLVEGRKFSQIAKELEIAEQTVRNHASNIYSKLGFHDRIEILRYINEIRSFLERVP